ncbi:MAG: ABC transporter ATP-binding protein [Lachnospiraceae bacterium]|nr:ABC transporter ATP-binding protein [uncultured Acetatifactor sp.]MCI9219847.1 ABC transporter ATP-binding protein [Lachnospiraceae bacterium]
MKQAESRYEKHYNIFQNIGYYFGYYRRSVPVFLWLCLVEIVFGAVSPLFGIYLPKLAVDLVTSGVTMQRIWLTIGIFGGLLLCVRVAATASERGKYYLYNTRRNELLAKIFLKTLRIPYRHMEEGETKELYWKAIRIVNQGDWCALHKLTYGTISMIQNVLSFFLYSTVLSFLNPFMAALLMLLALAQYAINIRKIKYMERFRDEDAELGKKKSYLFYSAMGNQNAAKDIRIFGMQRWLNKEKDILLDWTKKLAQKKNRAEYLYWQLGSLLNLGRDIFAYGYLLREVLEGTLNPGEFVLYFGAITGFSGFVGSIMNSLANLRGGSLETNYYRSYMELPEEDRKTGQRHISELPQPMSIEFRNVSFSYDKSAKILDHFNLKINAGEKLALVGVNGAGKTTFVKLLTGMYEPDEGSILIGGVDRNEFPREELYRLFSAVFQEPFLLPVTVGENLTFEAQYDSQRAWKALEDADLAERFREKGVTMDTFFYTDMDESGMELSGGETQRFLLARALYKDGPVLVLDEPTAALDPIAESEIYDKYARYSENKTAIFISHRLASTRFSDRIVLLGEGGILEEGSHQELMEKKGTYAEMFQVQSRYYAGNKLEKEVF